MPKIIPMPPEKDLRVLYEDNHLSTVEIGKIYGASARPVEKWLRFYDITVRAFGRGMANQGKRQPTCEELTKFIHEEHRSYESISQDYGVTLQAVYYWMNKYHIERPNYWNSRPISEPGLPAREEFLQLYEQGMSIEEVSKHLNLSVSVLMHFCKKNEIQLRPNGWKGGQRLPCKDGHVVLSLFEQRVDDWLSEHAIPHVNEPPLPFNRKYRADFLANGWYIEIWGVKRSPKYLQRKSIKTNLYKKHQLPLIEIYTYHFDLRRDDPWKRVLRPVLSPSTEEMQLHLFS